MHSVPEFIGLATLLVVTPGAGMALVTKNALVYGRRAAVLSALGIDVGIVTWTFAAALGLAALLRGLPLRSLPSSLRRKASVSATPVPAW
jgi:threonine/homoserine/homoserine lactone efflux protein